MPKDDDEIISLRAELAGATQSLIRMNGRYEEVKARLELAEKAREKLQFLHNISCRCNQLEVGQPFRPCAMQDALDEFANAAKGKP